jgi:hypothetical protein
VIHLYVTSWQRTPVALSNRHRFLLESNCSSLDLPVLAQDHTARFIPHSLGPVQSIDIIVERGGENIEIDFMILDLPWSSS